MRTSTSTDTQRDIKTPVPDLWWLADQLRTRMEHAHQKYAHYLGGTKMAEDLAEKTNVTSQKLFSSYADVDGYQIRIFCKEKENAMKPILLSLEFLLSEIEAFQEKGEHSEVVENSFSISTSREAKFISEKMDRHGFRGDYTTWEIMDATPYENQKQELVELLLDSQSAPVVPILGKIGCGKSALARLVYNDDEVSGHFDYRHWISFTNPTTHKDLIRAVVELDLESSLEPFEERLSGLKYLFVFDGLSNADIFKSLLSGNKKDPLYNTFVGAGVKGSKILVTSRLEHQDIGAFSAVRLPALSEDDSWTLFLVTKDWGRETLLPTYVNRQICKQCENIPAVINIITSIIPVKPEETEHFLGVVLKSVPNPIATISFAFDLMNDWIHKGRRQCFSWCSLLPIDYKIRKDHLFLLLEAQPFYTLKWITKEDLDQFFTELVCHGYFIQCDNVSCKVSYLGHELMKHVAGDDEFCLVDEPTRIPDHKIVRHASFIVDSSWYPPSWLHKAKLLQSLLLWPRKSGEFIPLPKIDLWLMRELRTVHFVAVGCESLPIFTAKIKKLKYLKLGAVSSISLPDDIPTLNKILVKVSGFKRLIVQYEKCDGIDSLEETQHFLESLDVQPMISSYCDVDDDKISSLNLHQTLDTLEVRCWDGDKLPKWVIDELSIFLRSLVSIQIVHCVECRYLPAFNTLPHLSSLQLRGLYSLVNIEISCGKSEASTKTFYPSLKCLVLCDLPELIGWSTKEVEPEQPCFSYLTQITVKSCPKLVSGPSVEKLESLEAIDMDAKLLIDLMCPHESLSKSTSMSNSTSSLGSSPSKDCQEMIETTNQPLSLIQNLKIDSCRGFGWGDIPNTTEKCVWRGFKHLRSLKLSNIVEIVSLPKDLKSIVMLEQLSLCWLVNLKFLPEWIGQLTQLRQITIHYCPKLITLPNSLGSFSALELLEIQYCPRLTRFPESFPNLKSIRVREFNSLEPILRGSQSLEELEINSCEELEWDMDYSRGKSENSSVKEWRGIERIHTVKVSNMTELEPLSKGLEWLTSVHRLSFSRLHNLLILPGWIGNFSKLRRLSIQFCPKLTTLHGSIDELYNLEQLHILHCPKFTSLPESFCRLDRLWQLLIQCCPEFRQLPRSIRQLTSLKQLEILESAELERRCQNPIGADWRLIKHIPNIFCGKVAQQENSTYISFS